MGGTFKSNQSMMTNAVSKEKQVFLDENLFIEALCLIALQVFDSHQSEPIDKVELCTNLIDPVFDEKDVSV